SLYLLIRFRNWALLLFRNMSSLVNRRAKSRQSQTVVLTVFTGDQSNTFRGILLEASRSRLSVVLDSAIALGSVVEVRSNCSVVYGEVRVCGKAVDGLGFEITVVVEEGLSGEWLREC